MKKNRFLLLMVMVIVLCFVSSTAISTVFLYQVLQKHALKNSEIIAAGIYNDINSRLLEPVIVANTLASDNFLIELLEKEEEIDAEEISREMDEYTTSYMKNFSYRTVFVASEKTKAYYTYDGFYKIMDVENDEDDAWYQEFVDSGKKYTVMLGGDEEYPDLWLIYIDVRIEDEEGNFLGVCGVSMELQEIQKQIAKYEKQYDIDILFTDAQGNIQAGSGDAKKYASFLQKLPEKIIEEGDHEDYVYEKDTKSKNYTITKYMKKFDWYMVIHNLDTYAYINNYILILANVVVFLLCLLLVVVSLHIIAKRDRGLFDSAYRDELTGIYNRRAYEESLNRIRKEVPSEKTIVVTIFDVNGLKEVNDNCGHTAGDELLKGAASTIQSVYGSYGKCYRTGGDEFVAILEEPIEKLSVLKENFEEMIAKWYGKQVSELNISYGTALSEEVCSIDEQIILADQRMYLDKKAYYQRTGKDRRKY